MSKKIRTITFLGSLLAVVMLTIMGLLVLEYVFFRREMERLLLIKEDYNNYALALKKMMLDYEQASEQSASQGTGFEKKKPLTTETHFSVLNREAQHLKQSALSFARRYNMEPDVRRLYETDETHELVSKQHRKKWRPSKSSSQRRVPHRQLLQQTMHDWQEHAHEISFAWPIERDSFWLSSPFGPRKQPNGAWGFHYGMDMAAVRGTPVKASAQGIVIEAGFAPGYGNTIVLAHGKKFRTRYAHLAKILVNVGDKVAQGELIGKVGDTGNARKRGKDASHLHFEVSIVGKKVNPLYVLG